MLVVAAPDPPWHRIPIPVGVIGTVPPPGRTDGDHEKRIGDERGRTTGSRVYELLGLGLFPSTGYDRYNAVTRGNS